MNTTNYDSINLNDLFTNEAYREFLDSKLYYVDKISEENQRQLRNLMVPDNPNHYTDYLNLLIEHNLLNKEDVKDNINSILITIITNILRPILYNTLYEINEGMEHYGQFIIAGGEAFNLNVEKSSRKLTPDIDTKFIPYFGKNIPSEAEYTGAILKIKEYFWYEVLEKAVQNLNNGYDELYKNVLQPLENCPEFKLFTFKFIKPKSLSGKKRTKGDEKYHTYTPPFRKRSILIPKNRGEKDMFYDLNLFAIDLFVQEYKFFPIELQAQKISIGDKLNFKEGSSIDGILDLAFMRPGQFGYEVSEPGNNTVISVSSLPVVDKEYKVPTCLIENYSENITSAIFTDKKIRIASAKFLAKDIEEIVALKLRPGKSSKDLYRQLIIPYDKYYKKVYANAIKQGATHEQATEYAHNIGEIYKSSYDYAIKNNATHIHAVNYAMLYADAIAQGATNEQAIEYAQENYLKYPNSEEDDEKMEDYKTEIIIEPTNIKTPKFNTVFNRDNINPLTISKVLRLIAPPTIPDLEQEGLFEMNIFTDKFNKAQRNENGIPLSEAEKFLPNTTIKYLTNNYERDYIQESQWQQIIQSILTLSLEETTGIRYNLSQKRWSESCCETEPKNITCCDPIGNQFKFRIHPQQLGFWLFTDTPKFQEIIEEIFIYISIHIDKIKSYIDDKDFEKAKDMIGMMFYEYNPTYNSNIDIIALLSNVLIVIQSLTYVDGRLGEFININIISKLLDMRVHLLKIASKRKDIPLAITDKEHISEDLSTITFKQKTTVYKAMSWERKGQKYKNISFYTLNLDIANHSIEITTKYE